MTAITAVSVIVPHYGDPKHAQSLVEQLLAQVGGPEREILVVDDASPQPYPDDDRVRVIRRERNGGFGAAVNTAARNARHPYLLVLNSDLSVDPTFLADLCAAAAPYQSAVVGPMVLGPDGRSQWSGRAFPRTRHQVVEWLTILARFNETRWRHWAVGHDLYCVAGAITPVDWLVGAALLVPADQFRAVGGFDEGFHMNCEEIDLQWRLRARGIPSIFLGTTSVEHLGGASSGDTARRRAMLVRSRLRYARKWHQGPGMLRAFLAAASLANLLTNLARRLAGRRIAPLAVFRAELGYLYPSLARAGGHAA